MIDNDVGNGRRLPRRRMYHDVKVSNLLHASSKGSKTSRRSTCSDFRETEAALRLLISPRQNGEKCLETIGSRHDLSPPANTKENNASALQRHSKLCNGVEHNHVTKLNAECAPTRNGLSEKNGNDPDAYVSNAFFQRFLHASKPNNFSADTDPVVASGNLLSTKRQTEVNNQDIPDVVQADRKVTHKSKRKSTAERRHTVSGANAVNIEEIESWLSENSQRKSYADDDVSLVIPSLRIVHSKLALTKSNDFYSREMFRWKDEKRGMRETLPFAKGKSETRDLKGKYIEWEEGYQYSCPHLSDDVSVHIDGTKTARERRDILSLGINHTNNCFLTPRPYFRNVTQHSSVTWKTSDVIMDQLSSKQSMVNGSCGKEYLSYSSDEQECGRLAGNTRPQLKSDSMYDTFLDLSKLDLPEDPESAGDTERESCEADKASLGLDQDETSRDDRIAKTMNQSCQPKEEDPLRKTDDVVQPVSIESVENSADIVSNISADRDAKQESFASVKDEQDVNGKAEKNVKDLTNEVIKTTGSTDLNDDLTSHNKVAEVGSTLATEFTRDKDNTKAECTPVHQQAELPTETETLQTEVDTVARSLLHSDKVKETQQGSTDGAKSLEVLAEQSERVSRDPKNESRKTLVPADQPTLSDEAGLVDQATKASLSETGKVLSEGTVQDVGQTESDALHQTENEADVILHDESLYEVKQEAESKNFSSQPASNLKHGIDSARNDHSEDVSAMAVSQNTVIARDKSVAYIDAAACKSKGHSEPVSDDSACSMDENSSCDDGDVSNNDAENLPFKCDAVTSKTMSLDRRIFAPKSLDQSVSPGESRDEKSNQSKDEGKVRNSVENAVARSGMRRLYQIAISTVTKDKREFLKVHDVMDVIEGKGLRLSDPRLRQTFHKIEVEPEGGETALTFDVFSRICEPCFPFIRNVLLSQLTVPGFTIFKLRMERVFERVKICLLQDNKEPSSNVDPYSNYNAMMRRHKRNEASEISMAVCTVDGQRFTLGDAATPHPLNSCAAVFNYSLACRQNGLESTTLSMGRNPKPDETDDFSTDGNGKVWNPFTKAGSFLTCTMLFRQMALEKRIDALHGFYSAMSGDETLCCDNLSYNYRRNFAHEETSLAYYLSHKGTLHSGAASEISDLLELYFQSFSTAMTSDTCAVGAATLANGGVCPLTGEAVLDKATTSHVLGVLRSSSTSSQHHDVTQNVDLLSSWDENGSLMFVVPGVMGITCFTHCQSRDVIKKVVTCLKKEISENFNFSVYKSLKENHTMVKQR